MKLSEICVRKPVFATVLSLFFLVLGVIGLQQLEMRFFLVCVSQLFAWGQRTKVPVLH